MPIINFLNETALTKSTDQNAGNLVNLYLVQDVDEGKYTTVAYPTPGGTLFSAGIGTSRAIFSEHGITYYIDVNGFYSINSLGVRGTLGFLNTNTGWAKIQGTAGELFIADSTNGYYYNIAGNVFFQITDANFPTSVQDITVQDEFGLVLEGTSQTWQASAISDLSTWPALSFASTTGNQNFNVGIVSVHRELFICGTQTTEVWDNLGTVNFTFGRNQSAYIETGCVAKGSIAKGDNSFFMLAQSPTGGNVVIRMNGYSPVKISNAAVDYQISTYSVVSDAIAFVYSQEGHEFYIITFPTAGVTWAYDLVTQMWHQRQSLTNGVLTNWLANCYTNNYNKCLVGDSNTGNIYQLDMTNFTENNIAITRTFVTHPLYNAGMWTFMDKLQIDFDTTPTVDLANWTLFVSRDGGKTFGSGKPAVVQIDANGSISVYWTRLGKAKTFVFKITTNANMKTIILGAWAMIRIGGTTQ